MSSQALKAVATGQVAKTRTIFDYLSDPRVAKGIGAVAGKYLDAERMLRLCVNAVKKTPKLLECDPQTVLGAMMTSASLGLEPNTVQQQAFLIPYKKRAKVGANWFDVFECQFQIGARGFVTLAYRSPHIRSITAEAIHDGDRFEHMLGSETFLRYAKALKDRGALIGAFSHVKLADGGETACVLPLEEVWKIRDRSETFKSLVGNVENADNAKDKDKAEKKLAETPWVMWEDDMASKSAIKKHAKQLPIAAGDALANAAEIDSRGEAGTIDMRQMTDVEVVRAVAEGDADAPALQDNSGETFDMGTGEVFGTRERSHVAAQQAGAGQAPAQATAAQHQGNNGQAAGDEWRPTPEEEAAIRARELAEAGGQAQGAPAAAPAAPPQRTSRRPNVAPE